MRNKIRQYIISVKLKVIGKVLHFTERLFAICKTAMDKTLAGVFADMQADLEKQEADEPP